MQRTLEELSLNAWPALASVLYDGWVLRFAAGYTRRANSVNPLYPSQLPLLHKIAACEAAYTARRQATIFKLTDATESGALDPVLADAGYQAEGITSVQITHLSEQPLRWDGAVSLAPSLPQGWVEDCCRLSGIAERSVPIERRMLQSIAPARAFATLREDGQALALGLAVAEHGYVGLFSIVTASHARNRGLGRRLVSHLLAWGRQRGAQAGYLAVVLDNTPAWRLYANFGFREAYRYWYRTRRWVEPVIRRAVPAEDQLVRACARAAYAPYVERIGREPAPMTADYPELIRRGVVYVLAGFGGEPVGGVLVCWPREDGLFVENVAVHPAAQGRGAGRHLLTFAEDQARALGLAAVWLYTNEAMTENLELYRRLGYVETGRRVEDGFRRVFLRKDLALASANPHA